MLTGTATGDECTGGGRDNGSVEPPQALTSANERAPKRHRVESHTSRDEPLTPVGYTGTTTKAMARTARSDRISEG